MVSGFVMQTLFVFGIFMKQTHMVVAKRFRSRLDGNQLELYHSTLGNISWRWHFGAFQLHNGTMLHMPIGAFPERTLLTPGAASLDTKGP